MRRIAVFLTLFLTASALGACAPAERATTPIDATPTSGETTRVLSQGNRASRSIKVGKTTMYLDGGKVYDPAEHPKTTMNGEPSDIPFFKPVRDEGILDRDYPVYDKKTFKFLAVSLSTVNPQKYYMFDKEGGSLNRAAAKTGYRFASIFDSGDIKILPNLYLGYYDFAWVPLAIPVELWSGHQSRQQELWRAGDDYVIIGAAYDEGDALLAAPEVKSLKDLAGKQVGIMNPDFDIEAAFNEMLSKEGLATESAGGDVKIVMASPGFVLNDLMAMNNAAAFARSKYAKQLTSPEFGYREIANTDSVWGGRTPASVLIVRRDILEKHPDIVQLVVQQNYDATKRALKSDEWKKPGLADLKAFKDKYYGPPVNISVPERPDAEANPVYLRGVYDYMVEYGYFKVPYAYGRLVDSSFYQKVKK